MWHYTDVQTDLADCYYSVWKITILSEWYHAIHTHPCCFLSHFPVIFLAEIVLSFTKTFTNHFPTLPHHTVNLLAISDACSWDSVFSRSLCSATSLFPHRVAWFPQIWISELCLSMPTPSFQQGHERLLLCGRASSLAKAVLALPGWHAKVVQGWASLHTSVMLKEATLRDWTQKNSHCRQHLCSS